MSGSGTVPPDESPGAPKRKHRALGKRVIQFDADPSIINGRRPTTEHIMAREDAVYRLRLLGKPTDEIATALGLAGRTVRLYTKRARDRHVAELRALEGKAGVAHQFQVLNYVLEESLAAWEKSKTPRKVRTAGVETRDGSSPTTTLKRTGQREEEQVGDKSFLDSALHASKQIRELLGLDPAEVKRLLLGPDTMTLGTDESLADLSSSELLARYRKAIGLGGGVER